MQSKYKKPPQISKPEKWRGGGAPRVPDPPFIVNNAFFTTVAFDFTYQN